MKKNEGETQKDNVCFFCPDKNKKECSLEFLPLVKNLNSFLSNLDKKQDRIIVNQENLRNSLEELKLIKQDKFTKEDINKCYALVEQHGYINRDIIQNDAELGIKYKDRQRLNDLYEILKGHKDLTFFKQGQGNKLWFCKKENVEAIKRTATINVQRARNKNIQGKSDIDRYCCYFLENYENEPVSLMRCHDILRDIFSIKTTRTRAEIIKRLSKRDDVKHSGNTFIFTSGGEEMKNERTKKVEIEIEKIGNDKPRNVNVKIKTENENEN